MLTRAPRTCTPGFSLRTDPNRLAAYDIPALANARAYDGAMAGQPLAYFLTWTTYGSWLHGDTRGSVDRGPDGPRTVIRDDLRHGYESRELAGRPVASISAAQRAAIESAVLEVCRVRGWTLLALNIRLTHIHAVVAAEDTLPERVLNDFKAWSTRRVRALRISEPGRRLWSRHGSTRYLWSEEDVLAARAYVLHQQGNNLPGSTETPPPLNS